MAGARGPPGFNQQPVISLTRARMLSSGVPMGTPHPAEMTSNPASLLLAAEAATSWGVPLNSGKAQPTFPTRHPLWFAISTAFSDGTFSSTEIPVTPVSNMYGMIGAESPQMCRMVYPFSEPRHLDTNCPDWTGKSVGARMSVEAEGSDIWTMSAPASSSACPKALQ